VPFFGVRAIGGDLWAIGTDGIYQIGADGVAKITALPPFRRIGNVSVSFALPEFVLVLTNVNQRRSVSGSVPMMVPPVSHRMLRFSFPESGHRSAVGGLGKSAAAFTFS
jgi:hypothetical protein